MRKSLNRALLVTTAILFVFAFITPSLHARTFSNIVAFGDSLTDHKGLSQIIGDVPEIGYIPEAWTNCPDTGPCVWVEYMAAEWDADVDNHAIGGAMTEGHENEDIEAVVPIDLGLVGQAERYVATNPFFDSDDTLFSVLIGGNDLLEFLRGEAGTDDPQVLIPNAMANISETLNDLEDAGAEFFLVLSLPDISASPGFVDSDAAERAQVQNLVQSFNSALETTVDGFEAANPGITIYRFDVFSFMNGLIADGVFKNTTGTYLVLDDEGDPTGATNSPADDYLFWDQIHPTTRAHELLGEAVADKIDDDDDDDSSTCFISTAAGQCANVSILMAIMGVVFGLSMTLFRRMNR